MPDLAEENPPATNATAAAKPKRARSAHADVDAAMKLLEWARRKGFRIGPQLTIGAVAMQVIDVRLAKRERLVGGGDDDDDKDDDQPPGILAEHGGPEEEPAEGTA